MHTSTDSPYFNSSVYSAMPIKFGVNSIKTPFLFFSVSLTIPFTVIPSLNFLAFSSHVPKQFLYDKLTLPVSLSTYFTIHFIFCPIFTLSFGDFILATDKSSIYTNPSAPFSILIKAPYGCIPVTIPLTICPCLTSSILFCSFFFSSS